MRRGVFVAKRLDPAVLLDELQLMVGVEKNAIQERHLVERAGDRALHAGAVITPDVEDQRVVELAEILDRVEQAADVPVRVFREPGEHLHLPGIELLFVVRQAVPRREQVGSLRQLRVGRNDAEPLLPLEGLAPVDIPALVELATVPVGPFREHVVRRVGGAGRVIHHPRLLGVLRPHAVQPLDGLVGEVVGKVVRFATPARRYALRNTQDGIVLGDDRVVLAPGAGQKTPEMVEAPAHRPVVERPRRALNVVRGQMPLAETASHITVVAQDTWQRGTTARLDRRIAREWAGEFADRSEAHPVVVAPGQQRRTRREHTAVT
jgi:hypothetical protein